jgi:hypothetical protein
METLRKVIIGVALASGVAGTVNAQQIVTPALAISPPTGLVQADRTHAMLALPRSKVSRKAQNLTVQSPSGADKPQTMPIYPPGTTGQ